MFKIGDNVTFGVRFSNGIKKGGIARLTGKVIDINDLITVEVSGRQYKLRELKGGWVEQTERDDPKGRLYLKKIEE